MQFPSAAALLAAHDRKFRLLLLGSVLGLAGIAVTSQNATQKDPLCDIQTTERVVAVGDVHGAFDRFVAILQEARLIDARRRWSGGKAILVQTGDIVDRGGDSRQALDLLRKLEGDARNAGGRVLALLGNHEVMRMRGELTYVSAAEYAAFKTPESEALRERLYTLVGGDRQKFLAGTPLGFVELRQAFLLDGEYGRWLRGHSVMVKINGIAFLHGGTTAAVAAAGCAGINAAARTALKDPKFPDSQTPNILTDFEGPLWFRGLVDEPLTLTAADVDGILHSLDARAIVVGHTVNGITDADGSLTTSGRIRSVLDGRVFQIDTGMLGGTFFHGGQASALEFSGKTITAIYRGSREVLSGPAFSDTPQPLHHALR